MQRRRIFSGASPLSFAGFLRGALTSRISRLTSSSGSTFGNVFALRGASTAVVGSSLR
jgi:hypothetical protein